MSTSTNKNVTEKTFMNQFLPRILLNIEKQLLYDSDQHLRDQ